ncbi:GntR family transcriptional regulator [Planosporangium flavigriseum]|uniref:GntR family transcriptional regulator n=1 Tax=Planosporangium flavigriseum TaxID=373681 RepID=UPI00143C0729|nr:GntR family transcriptional regulator [Planosporangium flavigriseum]NJC67908.1 GntR family transcriptional regulator [Planosporangium flavigriseum]
MKKVRVEGSLTGKVGEALRSAILSGELVAGQLYSVQDLAEVLGVSRTPVREALIRLASKGMVQFERNRGVRILQSTPSDLEEVFELRMLLEVPAARLAVARMRDDDVVELRKCFDGMISAADAGDERSLMMHDRRFHAVILSAAGNQRLTALVDSLRDLVLTRGVTTAGTSRTLHDIANEHLPIVERFEARDADGVASAMHAHVLHTARLLIKQEFDASTDTVDAWAAQVSQVLGEA